MGIGIPITLIGEAVYSHCLSALKEERVEAAKILKGPRPKGDSPPAIEDLDGSKEDPPGHAHEGSRNRPPRWRL